MLRRTLALLALLTAAVVLLATPAAAHVEVEPARAEAGTTTTLTFAFHHGLDGAATTGLEVKVPEGAEVVEVPPVEGWTASVSADGTVVSWSGGSVPDGVEASFPLLVRMPSTAGVALFPTIQTTEAGELAWISEDEGESEDQHPAPRVELVGGAAPSSTAPSSTASTRDLPRTALEADQRDDGGGSLAPWFIGSGIAAAAAIVVGGVLLRRRAG